MIPWIIATRDSDNTDVMLNLTHIAAVTVDSHNKGSLIIFADGSTLNIRGTVASVMEAAQKAE